jgi:hypothetical protein
MSYYRNTTHTTSDEGAPYHSVHVVLQKYNTYHCWWRYCLPLCSCRITAIRHIPLVMKVLLTILFMSYYRNTTHTTSDEGAPYHSVHVVLQKYNTYHWWWRYCLPFCSCRITEIQHIPLVMKVLLTILFMSYYRNTTHTTSDEGTAYHSVHVLLQKYNTYH